MTSHLSRRSLLAAAAAATSATAQVTTKPTVTARTSTRTLGANNRIQLGIIGAGGMGGSHLRYLMRRANTGEKDCAVMAVCDVYEPRRERARQIAGLLPKDSYNDYRELLARDDLDAVFIATPDHWHAQMSIDAMTAGLDVYLQKPMALTWREGRDIAAVAAQHRRVLQVGSQHASDIRHLEARTLIENGDIGTPVWAQGSSCRNSLYGEWNYGIDEDASPENLDWQRWLGSAERRAFSKERYFRWRKYWDYSGGIATDLFYHTLAPLMADLLPGFPTRVMTAGGIYVHKDREVPDTTSTLVEFPHLLINLAGSMANQRGGQYHRTVIHGHKGSIVFDAEAIRLYAEPVYSPHDTETTRVRILPTPVVDLHALHITNFFESMRARTEPHLGAQLGYQVMTAIHLSVESYRTGRMMHFDPAKQEIVDQAPARPSFEGSGENLPREPRIRN